MSTLYVRRLILICDAARQAAANTAANHASWDGDGAGNLTFTVPLSPSGNLPATHYWCSTALTNAQAAAVVTRLQAAGATLAERTPIVPGQTPTSTRFAAFNVDTDLWTPDQVLTACGLQRIGGTP